MKRKLKEMAYSKQAFNDKLRDIYFKNIINHFIRLNLTNPQYSNIIGQEITGYLKYYRNGWADELVLWAKRLKKFLDSKVSSSSKENIYREALEEIGISDDEPDYWDALEYQIIRPNVRHGISEVSGVGKLDRPIELLSKHLSKHSEWADPLREYFIDFIPQGNKINSAYEPRMKFLVDQIVYRMEIQ